VSTVNSTRNLAVVDLNHFEVVADQTSRQAGQVATLSITAKSCYDEVLPTYTNAANLQLTTSSAGVPCLDSCRGRA